MQLSIIGERETTIKRLSNRLHLTPRQFVLQAVDREIERLKTQRNKELKKKYGHLTNSKGDNAAVQSNSPDGRRGISF